MKSVTHLRSIWLSLFGVMALLMLVAACQGRPTPAPTAAPPAADATMVPEPEAEQPRVTLVVQWNEAMLAAIRTGRPRPTVVARQLYMTSAAMYDAWTMYDAVASPTVLDASLRRPVEEHTYANKAAAVSQAAYHMLIHFFPEYEAKTAAFSNLLKNNGFEPVMTADNETPAGLGYQAAQAIMADRADDGSNEANDYVDNSGYQPTNSADPSAPNSAGGPDFDPNHWTPLRVPTGAVRDANGNAIVDNDNPASYVDQVYLTPHWGLVRPFALQSGDQFRPQAPPMFGSDEPYTDALGNTMTNDEAYRMQVAEILAISGSLTDEQKVIAEYWADGPRSETPPGHWNALAHGVSFRGEHTLDDDIKMYLALNGAIFDASITAWETKRAYDYVRPANAIQHMYNGQMVEAWGGPNMGTQTIAGETWQPYQSLTFVTPPFPEYTSGHSTFSAASAEVLTRFTGSNVFYDGETVLYNEDFNRDGIPDMIGQHIALAGANMFEQSPASVVVLQWETFQEAADEAGISRRYGGIHFQDGDLFARRAGTQVGAQAFELAEQYWTGAMQP